MGETATLEVPKVGDIIRMHPWYGIVLDRFQNERGKTVLQVQTVRNIFRNYPPELIEYDLAPDKIEPATREDLEREIATYRRIQEQNIEGFLNGKHKYFGRGYG